MLHLKWYQGEGMMKIALWGATGRFGSRIAQEALARGHQVTAIVRNPARLTFTHNNLKVVRGNVLDPHDVATKGAGHDVVISAVGPDMSSGEERILIGAAQSLVDGVKRAGISRLIVVGGAGSLEVSPGAQLMTSPQFPAAWKPVAQAQCEALGVYRESDVNWTYFSPAMIAEPGERTGHYRTGTDQLITDETGKSWLSIEDCAVVLIDEAEKPRFVQQRFTAAY